MNGILGGLVGITAGADLMSPIELYCRCNWWVVVLAIAFMDKQNSMILLVQSLFTCLLVSGVPRCRDFGDSASLSNLLYKLLVLVSLEFSVCVLYNHRFIIN